MPHTNKIEAPRFPTSYTPRSHYITLALVYLHRRLHNCWVYFALRIEPTGPLGRTSRRSITPYPARMIILVPHFTRSAMSHHSTNTSPQPSRPCSISSPKHGDTDTYRDVAHRSPTRLGASLPGYTAGTVGRCAGPLGAYHLDPAHSHTRPSHPSGLHIRPRLVSDVRSARSHVVISSRCGGARWVPQRGTPLRRRTHPRVSV